MAGGTNSDVMHATCVAIRGYGALLHGPSGSGKSDLALRLIHLRHSSLQVAGQPVAVDLVADDQVIVASCGGRLRAGAPSTLAGLLEVRGLGILSFPYVHDCEIGLSVKLVHNDDVDRLPDPAPWMDVLGHRLPLIKIAPFEASAPLKVVLAILQQANRRKPWP